jgi:hypothetical protein
MWSETKQGRLNELRRQEQEGTLAEGDRQAFTQLISELEQEEWHALHPVLERLRQEQGQLQEQKGRLKLENAILAALAERQEDLLRRVRVELEGLLSEHEALKAEYERLTGHSLHGSQA